MTLTLENAGYEVITKDNGREALSYLTDENPEVDVIIPDVNMPEMGGIDLVREIRSNDRFRFTPIVIVTTESEESMKLQGKEAGASAWIVKPFEQDQLISVISQVIL